MKNKTKTILILLSMLFFWCGLAFAQEKWFLVKGGLWVPSKEALTQIKAGLEAYVKSESIAQGAPITRVDKYYFQYRGEIENGNKVIFINAMCNSSPNWSMTDELIFVLDGGRCYFNLEYDPKKNFFYKLMINGEA
jgi:hypothetical protein